MKFVDALRLTEEIREPSQGKKGCLVLDIDDTLLSANPKVIGIWKEEPGKEPVRLSSDEYAKDPDAGIHKDWFNYKEFRDPEKVYKSIVEGTPILKNLKLMDAHVRAKWDVAFLTARGLKDVVAQALQKFLMTKNSKGELIPIGDALKTEVSKAVNDDNFVKTYPGLTDPEKKAIVLKEICGKYDYVKFLDDDQKNVSFAKSLKIPNLQVIQAWS